jgi:pyridoxamine 5'-phosphate oxidase family protein
MRRDAGGTYRPRMDTVLTAREHAYLAACRRGCLATIGPDGGPDVVPVSYRLNADGTIDIGGPRMGESRKFRNIEARPRVAFVVDDTVPDEPGAFRPGVGRGIELRGTAEALHGSKPPEFGTGLFSDEIIRIHPEQCVSWHVDPDRPSLRVLRGHEAVYRDQ